MAGEIRRTRGAERHHSTETKSALKTTEFILTVVVIVAILASAALISGGDTGGAGQGGGADDEFIARQAWLYVAIVTGAYGIGRGLAKSGSSEPYEHDDH